MRPFEKAICGEKISSDKGELSQAVRPRDHLSTTFRFGASTRSIGVLRKRVAAEGPVAASRLSYFAARSSNRRLVNSSAFSARLRHRSACALRKFVSMLSTTEHYALISTVGRLDLRRNPTVNTLLTITFWHFYMRGTRLRPRETGALSMLPGGVDFASISLTKLRGLPNAAMACGDHGRVIHNSEASDET